MTFKLSNSQISKFYGKSKLYSQISKYLNKAYFKLTQGKLLLQLKGQNGIFQTAFDVDYSGDNVYFSTEYSKWVTVLQKFSLAPEINIDIDNNSLKFAGGKGYGTVRLGISTFKATSSEAIILDKFIDTKSTEIVAANHVLNLTPTLLSTLALTNSLFLNQDTVNSIGLDKDKAIYSDRVIVLKAALSEKLPNELFIVESTEVPVIYIHSFFLGLFPIFARTSATVYLSKDYNTLYWKDEDSDFIFVSDSHEVALPSAEDWEEIKPSTNNYISFSLRMLRDTLGFFDGFYEGNTWKPITFEIFKDKEVTLNYKHPTTDISRDLEFKEATADGSFSVDSGTLAKLCSRLVEMFPDLDVEAKIYFDEEAPGVFIKASDDYEAVLSKLSLED